MTMDRFELQKLRDLPIEEVAERLGLLVTRHKCLCPFHDDHHASLSFHQGRNTYRCFVCGASGGTIDLVMRYKNVSFKEAIQTLSPALPLYGEGEVTPSAQSHVKAFDASRYAKYFEHPFLSLEARHFLFDERKIDPRVVRWCRLTSWRDREGIPWLQIPYYNQDGKLVGVQNRNLRSGPLPTSPEGGEGDTPNAPNPEAAPFVGRGAPRFRFPKGSQCGIYNLPILNMLHQGEELWITEGCSDCWAMLSSGHKAIAIPSATLLTPRDIAQLTDINARLSVTFHMYPDHDAPGERLFLQLKEVLPDIVHHQLPQGCKDYAEAFLRHSTCGGMPD